MFNKIAFIGAGNMAEAIIKGLLLKETVSKDNLLVTDIVAGRLKYIADTYAIKTCSNNIQAINDCDAIVLAVKPQVIGGVLSELEQSKGDKLIISIVAGVTMATLDPANRFSVARAMPNTPALIGEAVTAIAFNKKVTSDEQEFVLKIFSALGLVLAVEEKDFDAVTALSGSGPAFVFRLLDYFMAAGSSIGLKASQAKQLVLQTFIGSVKLAEQSDKSIQQLIDQVTSPNGTTAAGREVLENSGIKKIISDTVQAAKNRAEKLSGGK